MTDLAGAVQIAIYDALSAVEGMPPVVSEAPVDGSDLVVYPFVLLGEDEVTQIGSKTTRLERHEVTIHVCMQSVPKLTVRAAQELVRTSLQYQPISAPGAVLSNPEALNQTISLLDDGATYIGSQVFVVLAQDA